LSRFEALKMDKTKPKNGKEEEENKWCGEATCIFLPLFFYAFGVRVFFFVPFFTASLCGFLPPFFCPAKQGRNEIYSFT